MKAQVDPFRAAILLFRADVKRTNRGTDREMAMTGRDQD